MAMADWSRPLTILLPAIAMVGVILLGDAGVLLGIMDAAILSISAGILVAYMPLAARYAAPSTRMRTRAERFAFGLFLLVLGLCMLRGYAITWRVAGRPDWNPNPLSPFTQFVTAAGLAILFSTPDAHRGISPPRTWLRVGIIVTMGAGVAFACAALLGFDDFFG